MMKKILFITSCLLCLLSCKNKPSITEALYRSGDNKLEIEKVINHYKQTGEEEKLEALYFLLANMPEKFGLDGDEVKKYDGIFFVFDSLHKVGVNFSNNSPLVKSKWDSIIRKYGKPGIYDELQVYDLEHIRASFLIEDIDLAFDLWKSSKWYKNLNFDDFCEWLLPYRIATEPLEPWRKNLNKQFSIFRDTASYKTSYEFAEAINKHLKPTVTTSHVMWAYPFGLPASKMQFGKRGACFHIVNYTAMVMRANGLPVTIDETKLWGNRGAGHFWNVLLNEDGRKIPFDGAQGSFTAKEMFPYKISKVYRQTFAKQNLPFSHHKAIPDYLLNEFKIDVTEEYTKTHKINVPLNSIHPFKEKYAVLCTFDNQKWRAQDWGEIKNEEAIFNDIGADVLYRVMYYHEGQYYPASEPFILQNDGSLRFFSSKSSQKINLELLRKYPTFQTLINNFKQVLGGKIQGANKNDFSDAVDLFTIKEIPSKLEEAKINDKQKFKYLRYVSPYKKTASISELEFYNLNNQKLKGKIIGAPLKGTEFPVQNAFDGSLETFFVGKTEDENWVGLALDKATAIKRVRYCTQNDTNFIIEGDTYELFCWNQNNWQLVAKQTAKSQKLNFKNMPARALYLLKNTKGGKEQRPFTYENGKQVWW
jgi:hypothetical protein